MDTYQRNIKLLISWMILMQIFTTVSGYPLGLISTDGPNHNHISPNYASPELHKIHRHYLQLNHLQRDEKKLPKWGVRPTLMTRPLPAPDPRLTLRPHPYSLLYLHYIPINPSNISSQ
ncbi:hypothetical protein SK128_012167 [Halocaridina rubra]|uniref:Uncharacterized protein n=1 Tax=Halocaridina rubra TaxID=373956 RepID=A0AAN8WXC0_HALRR